MSSIITEKLSPQHEEEEAGTSFPGETRRRMSPIREERVSDICECVLDIVAALFNVSGKELRAGGRAPTSVVRVRQIGMYVAHVVLQLNMTEIGRGFGRDRTTVQHACHMIEDLRDDEEFDRIVAMTERVTAAAFRQTEMVR
ncbi:helix-turn-helix domain-containing protein [Nitratireductor basaltis]|uniref:Chromosomal replication initiator, DnaA-like protein n=1 Tax=Nitratireductor basaltis TaxID=472175 RepID=A0A084UCI6_9HYPH|nr:helix-turn-helix domain-containing protein [Nitratireductor basaltis]KFB10672.1 Chromosomal replication initiator, DnaA-like protein [Nitratireductor basaltis]